MELTAIGIEAMKYMSGIGATVIAYYTARGLAPKKQNVVTKENVVVKPNGQKCDEHTKLMEISIESNTLLKEINKENKSQHSALFDKVGELDMGLTEVKTKVAFLNGKAGIENSATN